MDTRTRTRTARIPYRTTGTGPVTGGEYRGGGMGIALSPDGAHAYVGVNVPGTTGVLEVIDTATARVSAVVPVGRRPFDVDVSRDGSEVYVTGHDSFDVTVVPTGSLRPRRIEVAPYGTEGGLGSWLKPHYAAVRPTDGKLLLPFEGERLAVVDPRTGSTTIEKLTADTHQHGTTVTSDGLPWSSAPAPWSPERARGPRSRCVPRTARSACTRWRGRTRTWPSPGTGARPTSPGATRATVTGTASRSWTWTAGAATGSRRAPGRSASPCCERPGGA